MILRSTRVGAAVATLAVGAALVAGCTTAGQAEAPTSTDAAQLTVRTDPQPLRSGQPGAFVLEVTNDGDRDVAMSFDTTQRGDVALETNGVEVYRWAARRVFAHDEAEVVIGAGDTVTYRLDELRLPVGPGEYEVLATMAGRPQLQVVRAPLTVAGSDPSASQSAAPVPPSAAATMSPGGPSARHSPVPSASSGAP
jgi:hypothetical protein